MTRTADHARGAMHTRGCRECIDSPWLCRLVEPRGKEKLNPEFETTGDAVRHANPLHPPTLRRGNPSEDQEGRVPRPHPTAHVTLTRCATEASGAQRLALQKSGHR